MLRHLIIYFPLHYLTHGRLREVKNEGKIQILALKVVTVA